MAAHVDTARRFLEAGFGLVPIPLGSKGPRAANWHTREHAVFGIERAAEFADRNAGLAHAWSRTCAIDLDDFDGADAWLSTRGVTLERLFCQDDAVSVSSGRPNRGKLLYRLPADISPLPTRKVTSPDGRVLFELRCASSSGETMQDVVCGTHPEGTPYTVAGDPAGMPELPAALLELWRSLIGVNGAPHEQAAGPDEPIREGGRNERLFRLARKMHNAGATHDAILAALQTENQRCTPPLSHDEVRAIARSAATLKDRAEWKPDSTAVDGLVMDTNGKPIANELNALGLLRADRRFERVYFDSFRESWRTTDDAGAECALNDDHVIEALLWLQRSGLPRLKVGQARAALRALARSRQRDVLHEFIANLPAWDGQERIAHAFPALLGSPDDEYHRRAGRNFFIALAARAAVPGAQVHQAFVLEGKQGVGKSSFLAELGGTFYSEITAPIGSDNFRRELRGTWVAELAELTAMRRVDAEVVKAVLTDGTDRMVEKWEIAPREYPRRCVLCGSTNDADYLFDVTGNRRFVPVKVSAVDFALLAQWRLQLFSEAVQAHRAGCAWWEYPPAADAEREERRARDPWETVIAEFLMGRTETTVREVLDHLHVEVAHRSGVDEKRVARCLRALHWNRGPKAKRSGVAVNLWVPE